MFLQVIVPIIIIMSSGYLFGKFSSVELSAISKLSMTVLSPALIFSYLVRSKLTSTEMVQICAAIILFTIAIILVTLLVLVRPNRRPLRIPALLTTVFPNTGNYGLPVLLLAYGQQAFSIGIVVVILNFVLMYSLGVYFAMLETSNWRSAFISFLRLPTTYATIAALIVHVLNIPIPNDLYNPLKMVGDAMIPIAMLILGIQIARTKPQGHLGSAVSFSIIRLIGSPLVMIAIVYLLGIQGLMAKVLVVQNSMPSAVVMTMIAAEYGAYPEIVASTTFLSTLVSFVTITGLLYGVDRLFA